MKVGLIGYGYLGQAYFDVFPEAYVYDEPKKILGDPEITLSDESFKNNKEIGRSIINQCDVAIIAVPTDPLENGALNMEIVEDIVDWCESETILIKSALMPGTVDKLVEKTGKDIAVSVEYIGMGNYYIPPEKYPDPKDPRKHKLIVVGGEEPARTKSAELLWSKMSPDTRIHLVSALEAEITKLVENSYGAFKVTFANCLYNLAKKSDANFINIHQAWSEDGRVDPMHTRVVDGKRGWKSHCYDKDIDALTRFAIDVGANDMAKLFKTITELNNEHLKEND